MRRRATPARTGHRHDWLLAISRVNAEALAGRPLLTNNLHDADGRRACLRAINQARAYLLSAASRLETSLVLAGRTRNRAA